MLACGDDDGAGDADFADDASEDDATSPSDVLTDRLIDFGPPCMPGANRVFVTSRAYTGDLATAGAAADGLAGGDAICQRHAAEVGLGGEWIAWLSSGFVECYRPVGRGPWYTVDRCELQVEDRFALIDEGPVSALRTDEAGATVDFDRFWTGTDRGGNSGTIDNCEDWTSASPSKRAATVAV